MEESNKPSWSSAPEWANWLACDGDTPTNSGWWWYEKEPLKSTTSPRSWNNHAFTKFKYSQSAPIGWSKTNWEASVEARPGKSAPILSQKFSSSNPYVATGPSKHKRVTLFIDFDANLDDDEALSYKIASVLKDRLSDDAMIISGATVDRVRIAVGVNKTNEINYDPDECEFYIDGEEPEHDDDTNDDDDTDDDDEF